MEQLNNTDISFHLRVVCIAAPTKIGKQGTTVYNSAMLYKIWSIMYQTFIHVIVHCTLNLPLPQQKQEIFVKKDVSCIIVCSLADIIQCWNFRTTY